MSSRHSLWSVLSYLVSKRFDILGANLRLHVVHEWKGTGRP